MSAYALPGSIFPPMGGSCSSHDNQTNVSTAKPLHHFSDVAKKEKLGSIASDSDSSHCYTRKRLSGSRDERPECATEVDIAVKDAKIDPVRLVQSLTASSSCNRGSPNDISSRSRMKRDLAGSSDMEQSVANIKKGHTPHEDAIQFELSISFNGRTYSATRTLPRIIALRNDLIRELNTRRRQLQNQRMRWQIKALTDGADDDDTVSTVEDENEPENWDVTIPEIPECDTESGSIQACGVTGRGFAMLQALLRPYCPAMERWLQNVANLVPPNSSPSLANFLWEPVSVEGLGDRKVSRSGLKKSCSSLDCIQEDDSEEEGCNEDREEESEL